MHNVDINNIDMKPYMPPLPPHIPTEVCENVVDKLFSRNPEDTLTNIATLHSCALVCRAWRVRSQRRLFYKVQLSDSTSLHRLSTIFDNGPHLRDYVYQVELTGYHLHNTTSIFALFPHVFAGKLPNLELIDVVHFPEAAETRFPKTAASPKAKSIPFIPLHPHFSAILRSFTTVSTLHLVQTTFRSFSELLRTIRALTNLEELACLSVRWTTTGGSHPGADFMQQPDWAAGRLGHTLPPFVPKLRTLVLYDIALYGMERLILTHGPRLTLLNLTIPLSHGEGIDLGSCTALEKLELSFMSGFSVDTHGELVKDVLASWKPRRLEPLLALKCSSERRFTRRAFADVLRGLGAITEAWLQTVEEPHLAGDSESVNDTCRKYKLDVQLHDWETEKEWWAGHVRSCFLTWLQLGRLSWSFKTREYTLDSAYYEGEIWAEEEESLKLGTSIPASHVEEVDSCSSTKVMAIPWFQG
ncbi:hypothetical protein V8D89_007958 [Ganoderma adspersum]